MKALDSQTLGKHTFYGVMPGKEKNDVYYNKRSKKQKGCRWHTYRNRSSYSSVTQHFLHKNAEKPGKAGLFRHILAKAVGFEPTRRCRLPDFEGDGHKNFGSILPISSYIFIHRNPAVSRILMYLRITSYIFTPSRYVKVSCIFPLFLHTFYLSQNFLMVGIQYERLPM